MEELQQFYQRERDTYRTKIYNLESELDKTRTELTNELENLSRQLERTKYQTDYLEKVES